MNDEPTHGKPTTIRASKGGGNGAKWLLGGLAAVVLLGGGYYALKNYTPTQSDAQTAYNDQYSNDQYSPNSTRAGPLASDEGSSAETASSDENALAPATRRSTTRADTTPEETIGITPVNATTGDDDEVYVTAPRRPVWASVPSARRLSAMYPTRALERGREGEARLHCTVLDDGALDCVRLEETPGGFGGAAMRVAHSLRHSQRLADGSDATGSPVNLRVVFRIDDEDQRRG